MESGVYVTFVDPNDAPGRDLPPVGPLDHVVIRQNLILAERRTVTQAEELGVSIERWLQAELELQRAMGQEPGPPKRTDRRFIARDGVYLRFLAFGDAYEGDAVPEIGPFAVVVVNPRQVEADGTVLATRPSSDLAAWTLTPACGDEHAGKHKADIALRTTTTAYHHQVARITPPPKITAAPPPSFADTPASSVAEPTTQQPPSRAEEKTFTPPPDEEPTVRASPQDKPTVASSPQDDWQGFVDRPKKQIEIYSAQQEARVSDEELTPADRALIERIEQDRRDETLRARIQGEERKRLGVDATSDADATTWAMRYRTQPSDAAAPQLDEAGGLEWGPALWRMRFVIIGVLAVFVAGYYLFALLTGNAPTLGGSQQTQFVNVAQRFSSARWDYIVNGTLRVNSAGTARPRGEYYIVRVAVTNKGTEGLQTSPADFTLYDANGTDYRAEPLVSGPYRDDTNTGSQYIWPQSFPIGRTVNVSVIFDIPAGLPRGMLLKVSDLPNTSVRLE